MRRIFAFLLLLSSPRIDAADLSSVSFNRDVRPILSENCFYCHGQVSKNRKAGMRLDIRDDAIKTVDSGAIAVVPGNVDQSEIIRRIFSTDSDEQMPPPHSNRMLSDQQKETLKRWIAEGATYEAHWSFIAPVRPVVPNVKDDTRALNEIDRFILATLERNGLNLAPEAERTALIRRLSLDLTGLPPTIEAVDAFVADTDPGSYEKLVDRLLSSPHFGERMALEWLDAARYADTNGYQSDGERSMWRWRDWVIEAYNRNMPFDQFTIDQLAGDLLPDATYSQRLATAFNRNHRGNGEGGIVPAEYAAEYVVDRVDTTATVWLGLTIGCARCHDHKYDALTQREFYRMFAFFNNVPESGRAIKIGNSPPMMMAPTATQEDELAELEKELHTAERQLSELEPKISASQTFWEQTLKAKPPLQWSISRSLQAKFELAGDYESTSAKFEDGPPAFVAGRNSQVAVLDGNRFINVGDVGDFGFFDKFTLAIWIRPKELEGAILSRMVENPDESAFASDGEGYRVSLKNGKVQVHLTKRWLDDALRVETESDIPVEQWRHLAVVYDGSRLASGVKIYIDGVRQEQRVLLDLLNQTFQTKQPLRIGTGGGPASRFRGMVSGLQVFGRALSEEEIGIVAVEANVSELAAIPATQRTAMQSAKLRACFLSEHADLTLRDAKANVERLREQRLKLVEAIPTVMVMEEMKVPRETFVLTRGEYDKPGDRVTAGVPAALPPLSTSERVDRLSLARWLVSPMNPLTARVTVNRQWQMIFGQGLVKTSEDFGSQGEPPSHPELLDWLASEFMRTGWNVKDLLKKIVMSASYRQSSRVTPELLERDPENRWLARSPRLRLPAQMIRDQALSVSGLLVDTIGGPSVKPYQPKGLWKELSGTDYEADRGDKLWRRSLYTFWKRTSPQPTMMTFDAASREMCSVRQSRTSTPLQALALMNDVTFVEAARRLAERTIREGGNASGDRVRFAFRCVLARFPTSIEQALLIDNLQENLSRYRQDSTAALALVSQGESARDEQIDLSELAAYTVVAGLILNLDEAITKP